MNTNQKLQGCIRQKSVVNDGLAKLFPSIKFDEVPLELDYVSDVDYLGYIGEKAFGIQIKVANVESNFEYSISERMKGSFQDFEADYGGKVFIIFSLDGEIANNEVLKEIEQEIDRLKNLNSSRG
jgi:hypothetical protein